MAQGNSKRRPPAFSFYATDWNGSKAVQLMTARQCGYYINLLARAWDDRPIGTLPNDPDVLWRLAKAESKAQFELEGRLVLEQFRLSRDGTRLIHPRLIIERRKQSAYSKQKRAAGLKGAKAKWDNKKRTTRKHGTSIPAPMAENGFSSSISSSISSSKSSSDDDPLTLLSELQAKYPSYQLTAEDVTWACGIIAARANAPPGSLAYWRKALIAFMENGDAEIAAWRKRTEAEREAHAGHNPYGRAN